MNAWPGGAASILAGAVVAVLVPGMAAGAERAAPKPTVASCLEAWNRAPARLRAGTVRRHSSDSVTQVIAAAVTGSGPVCGVMFFAGREVMVLVAGRWTGGAVEAWSTGVGTPERLFEGLTPYDVGVVVFRRDGKIRPAPQAQPGPTTERCVRDWNRRPSAPRLALARARPTRVLIGPGKLATVRDGVPSETSALGCRVAFLFPDDSFKLVFGVWGTHGRVGAWKAQPNPAGPLEVEAMRAGVANAVIRQDGTLRRFS